MFCPTFPSFQIPSLSISRLTLHVQIVSFTEHTIICTNATAHFFALGLKKIFDSMLTHVSWYRIFITNGIYYINKMSHHHINTTTFAKLFLIQIITFSPLFIHTSWQVVIPRCQWVWELENLAPYVPCSSLLTDPIHSQPTFWLNFTSSKFLKLFPRQPFCASLNFL